MFANTFALHAFAALTTLSLASAEGALYPAIPGLALEARALLEARNTCPSGYDSCDGTSNWCCPLADTCYTDAGGSQCCCSDPAGCSGICPPPSYFSVSRSYSVPAVTTPAMSMGTLMPAATYTGSGGASYSSYGCYAGYGMCNQGGSAWCCPLSDSCYVDSAGSECCCADPSGCSGACPPLGSYSLSYLPSVLVTTPASSNAGNSFSNISGGGGSSAGAISASFVTGSGGNNGGGGGPKSTRTRVLTQTPGGSSQASVAVASQTSGAGRRQVELGGSLVTIVVGVVMILGGGLMVWL